MILSLGWKSVREGEMTTRLSPTHLVYEELQVEEQADQVYFVMISLIRAILKTSKMFPLLSDISISRDFPDFPFFRPSKHCIVRPVSPFVVTILSLRS